MKQASPQGHPHRKQLSLLVLLVVLGMLTRSTEAFSISSRAIAPPDGSLRNSFRIGTALWVQSQVKEAATFTTKTTKKKLKARRRRTSKHSKNNYNTSSSPSQTWRIFGIEVHPDCLLGEKNKQKSRWRDDDSVPIDQQYLNDAVLESLAHRLKLPVTKSAENSSPMETPMDTNWTSHLHQSGIEQVRVVRRSLDARLKKRRANGTYGPRFVYVLDLSTSTRKFRAKVQPGRMEIMAPTTTAATTSDAEVSPADPDDHADDDTNRPSQHIVIVGAGPAGLFCALQLAQNTGPNVHITLLERGQPVESRGRDIGALMHRRFLNPESNFAFGEGGAGTWSDGKLTTRIGRNSQAVRQVLETLVRYGAPPDILVHGSPHLGTDNLVRLCKNMRRDLREQYGATIEFGSKVTRLLVDRNDRGEPVVRGVEYKTVEAIEREHGRTFVSDGGRHERLEADAVVLATGHSARDMYESLHAAGVPLEPKGFAVGFRIEHPQAIINKIQYGTEWGPQVHTGKQPTDQANREYFEAEAVASTPHNGTLPVPSYRLATDKAFDGAATRGVYSFCMCPGGQIVPASTDPEEVCVNGMSFSRRDSTWANSALVVTVAANDTVLDGYRAQHGVLAGLAFQQDMERRAAVMGGGNLTVPVQRVTDFMDQRASTSCPSSSYRLGVRPAACHELYPAPLVRALQDALTHQFNASMPGYVCEEGLLHGVETRTSSPVRISRNATTLQAVEGLYPAGEGAGFAGGIVSAAVDGLVVAEAVLDHSLMGQYESATRLSRASGKIDSFY